MVSKRDLLLLLVILTHVFAIPLNTSATLSGANTTGTSTKYDNSSFVQQPGAVTSTQQKSGGFIHDLAVAKTIGVAQLCQPRAASEAIPALPPQSPVNLLQVNVQDAPYETSEAELLAAISFPNGLRCRKNLVILVPGTAVPATDTFSSTFIPVFNDVDTADADVLLVTITTISLGDLANTAEYIAFAMNYARFVLGKQPTILAWSQGNLNVQWALKYWPSTRDSVRNYVALSPDYDGTLDASFLCNPDQLLAQNVPQLATDFVGDGGLSTSLKAILGISKKPTTAEQFKLHVLDLLTGAQNVKAIGTSPVSALLATPQSLVSALDLPLGRRDREELPISASSRITRRRVAFEARQMQNSGSAPLQQLAKGLAEPIQQAVTSLSSRPGSVLEQVLANQKSLTSFDIPAVVPQGCLPGIWQQVYLSNFIQTLARNYGNGAGNSALVPTTTIYSLFDEVVQPQGATGIENASGYLSGASNILIQDPQSGGCPAVASAVTNGLPTVITHEGVLYSGMGIETAVLAVRNGGQVLVADVPASVRCQVVSPRLTVANALAQEATIPGALVRILLGGGTQVLAGGFASAEPPIKEYATHQFLA